MSGGYCPGHRERYDGDRCPTCAASNPRNGRPCRPVDPSALRWPGWDILAPGAGAVLAVMGERA